MTLWIILTIMSSAAAVFISAPFIRRFDRPEPASSENFAVFRDQLKEIETETALGLIDATQADAATMEIKRRILADAPPPTLPPLSREERQFALVAVTGIVVLGSVALYAITGSPDLPSSVPNAFRASAQPRGEFSQERAANTMASSARPASTPSASVNLAPVDDMIQRLVTRLKGNAKDVNGWRTLGWAHFSTEHFAEAASAYATAIELAPNVAELRSARGEALIRAANGHVTTEAEVAISEALKLNPKDPRGRYLAGLTKKQSGNIAGALKDWTELLSEADANEPWIPELRKHMADLDGGTAAASVPPLAAVAGGGGVFQTLRARDAQPGRPLSSPGPSPVDIANAATMSPGDRDAMVRGMVERLALRLDQSPRDAEGWIRLLRSRMVLGDATAAKASLERALSVFSDDASERDRISAAARELGINP